MSIRSVFVLLAAVLLLLSSALAQGAPTTQLCVAAVQVGGLQINDPSFSTTAVQNAFIKDFAKQKNSRLETVTLKASAPDDALAEAKEKKCEYVVTTNVAEIHSESGYTGGLAGVNMQNFFVTVNYKLNKVADGAEQASGSVKASDRSGAQTATIETMKKISEKVAGALKNAGSAPAS
jgi:hypothetical protein